MKVEVQKSFEKDVSEIRDKKRARQLNAIIEKLEKCQGLSEIAHVKKMAGKGSYYRIRIGDYRLGIKVDRETLILLRYMHRKEIYSYFP